MDISDIPMGLADLKSYITDLRTLSPQLPPEAATVFNSLVESVCEVLDTAHALGRIDGAASAIARVRAILTAPEASFCPKLACHLALDTVRPAEESIATMTVAVVAVTRGRGRGHLDA